MKRIKYHLPYRPSNVVRITTAVILLFHFSCKDFVEIEAPRTELTRDLVFTDDRTANAAMAGVYVYANTSGLYFSDGWFQSDVAYICGKSADEIGADSENAGIELFENQLTPSNQRIMTIWRGGYVSIYRVNAILEGLAVSSTISQRTRRQLEGEAKFMRAFNYFYLVNLFGEVPLLSHTDYRVNSTAARASVPDIYELIVQDLKDAVDILPMDFSVWNNERIRPNQFAARAFLARVYLYLQDWENAEIEATNVIGETGLFSIESDLNRVFLKNNTEAIWQFYPPQDNLNTTHGYVSNFFYDYVPLTNALLNAFETNDNRKLAWVGNSAEKFYAYKYRVGVSTTCTEYTTNLRLAEQFLIRAEARAQQSKIQGAMADTNVIRNRAGLANTTASTKNDLLNAIKQERRVELFAEYGHRWLDLKRWGEVDVVLDPVKPQWQSTDALYPIPGGERTKNRNLTQNPGYADN